MSHQIIATLGPASEHKIDELVAAGVTCFRLNLSHNTWDWHRAMAERIHNDYPKIAIMLDTRGNELRIVIESDLPVQAGQKLTLMRDQTHLPHLSAPVECASVAQTRGFLGSGEIGIEFVACDRESVTLTILNDGVIRPRMHIHLQGIHTNLPTLTEADITDLKAAREQLVPFTHLAVSFCQTEHDITSAREYVDASVQILPKIETPLGLENAADLIRTSAGVIVARGDLALELTMEQMPHAQRLLVGLSTELSKESYVATGLLRSMVESPYPARSEVNDIAHAVWQGATGFLISDETAIGKYPVETITTLKSIAAAAHSSFPHYKNVI